RGEGGATGARAAMAEPGSPSRLLAAKGGEELRGRGIYYGATASEARNAEGGDVYIVGAANAAGQAVLNFARYARRVVLLVRGDSLEKSMSQYLVERIRAAENIDVRLNTEVLETRGDEHLESLTLIDRVTGEEETVESNW